MSPSRTGLKGFAGDLLSQQESLGSRAPGYRAILNLLSSWLPEEVPRPPLGTLARAWAHRSFEAPYDRPLLLLASLRADALRQGESHPLWGALGAESPDPAQVTASRLEESLDPRRSSFYRDVSRRFVQTNETSRAVVWMWPAALLGWGSLPFTLFDLGCSAGLNLVADHLPSLWIDEGGSPLPVPGPLSQVIRRGVDLAPLRVSIPQDADWLRACVWAGETPRSHRLEAALSAFLSLERAGAGPLIETGSVRNIPSRLQALTTRGERTLAFHSVMVQYLSPADRARMDEGMKQWLMGSTPGFGLWVSLEMDETAPPGGPPASILARWREGDRIQEHRLGRCGYHPSVVETDWEGTTALLESPLRISPPSL